MDINDLKLYALQQAAQNASAPQTQGGNGLDQILNPQQAQVTSPTPTQDRPGPLRSFLSNFLYGAGQGMVKRAGLETDAEKQSREIQNQATQQNAATQQLYRQAYANQVAAQNQPVDLSTFGIEGLTGTVPQKDVAGVIKQHVANIGKQGVANTAAGARTESANTMADALIERAKLMYGPGGNGEPGGPLRHGFSNINGRFVMYDKATGAPLADLGQSNTITNTLLRPRVQAQYAAQPTIDTEGNPTVISRLQALQGGTPNVPFTASRQLASDRVGIQQYEDILNNKIAPNLSVLNDNSQRAIIAHTLSEAEKNPGAISSVITAATQQGLSPQGAALAAGILQGREFGTVVRKFGGNMNGTEGLYNRIQANQASPLNADQLNRELLQNDIEFTRKANRAVGGMTKRGVNPNTGTSTSRPSTPAANDPLGIR